MYCIFDLPNENKKDILPVYVVHATDAMFTEYFDSPIGTLEICTNESSIVSVQFIAPSTQKIPHASAYSSSVMKQIDAYFAGKSYDFTLFTRITQVTPFIERIWQTLLHVPHGTTMTYAALATLAGHPRAIRPTASAVARNPFLLVVPCHRIVPSTGGIGNFSSGVHRKEWLLQFESNT